jgi:hypothetical protein
MRRLKESLMFEFPGVKHFVYEASVHCVAHAIERFGADALADSTAIDNEGNPVGACYSYQECGDEGELACDECLYAEVSARWAREAAAKVAMQAAVRALTP